MILSIVSFALCLTSFLFVLYKTINHISLSKNLSLPKEQTSCLITSWILFLGFSSLKCCCDGTLGLLWNLIVLAALNFSLLNTKAVNKKLFEENTFEILIALGKRLVEKFLPKNKAE